MSGPVLSFVVPAYNAETTIAETLDSLLSQTRGDWEAVVVDDGSVDRTATVVADLAREDPRIRLVRTSNGGVGPARNLGLAAALGTWVTFLDADDWLAPSYAEQLLDLAADTGADAVYCGYRKVLPDGAGQMDFYDEELERLGFAVLARHCATSSHSLMVRRRVLVDTGGFDPSLQVCEDWDLWQRIARRGTCFRGLPQPLAFYRMRGESLSRDHRRLLLDGLTVQRRGHGADPRVPDADPRYVKGTGPELLHLSETFLAAWCAAAEVGAGGEGADLLDLVERPLTILGHESDLVGTILEGLATGARVAPGQLALRLPGVQGALSRMLTSMARGQPRPHTERGLAYLVEQRALEALALGRQVSLAHMAKVEISPGLPRSITLPPAVDRLIVDFVSGHERLMRYDVPVFGGLGRGDVIGLAARFLDEPELRSFFAVRRDPLYWALGTATSVRQLAPRAVRAVRHRSPRSAAVRTTIRAAFDDAARQTVSTDRGSRTRRHVADVRRRAAAPAGTEPPAADPRASRQGPPPGTALTGRAEQWDAVFAEPDPWRYGSEYERRKYDRTLDLLPPGRIGRALELACAEGHFTERLAERVDALVAADISPRAIARAADRCRRHGNVSFLTLDAAHDPLPADQDLIVCSEFLYYLDGVAELAAVAGRIRNALAPGGAIVTANHFLLRDDMASTGFDWDQAYGARVIHETFLTTPGLALESSLVTELYRVDRFRKLEPGEAGDEPEIRRVDLGHEVEERLARFIVWGGAEIRRREVEQEATWWIPVLMYDRVAETGPAGMTQWRVTPEALRSHLRLLRAHGFRSTTSEEILRHRREKIPMYGRPVLITFDDGYQDFADTAWPLLRAHDFRAEVFLVSDMVGRSSRWNESSEAAEPLMDWSTIGRLAGEGVRFGSHLATHTPATHLASEELLQEAVRSRETIAHRVGSPVEAVALPYGIVDPRLPDILDWAGYGAAYSMDWGIADVRDDGLLLPRITVSGHWSGDELVRALGLPRDAGGHQETAQNGPGAG